MKRVGIIGGMGPAATIDLYTKIVDATNAKSDQENIPILIDSFPQIPDRTAFIIGGCDDPYPFLKESALRLKNGRCDAICLACNTAHFFAQKLENECGVKVIHIAKNAVSVLKTNFPNAKNIAVIGTAGTKKAKIYENELIKEDYNVVDITSHQMQVIMDCIYKGAKSGNLKEYVGLFNDVLKTIKADAYIAACTEIPLFLPYCDKKDKFLDATNELAKKVVEFSKS